MSPVKILICGRGDLKTAAAKIRELMPDTHCAVSAGPTTEAAQREARETGARLIVVNDEPPSLVELRKTVSTFVLTAPKEVPMPDLGRQPKEWWRGGRAR